MVEALDLYVNVNYQEEVDNAEASLSDVNLLFWTELVGDVGKVSANQWKSNDETILSRKLQAHLKIRMLSTDLYALAPSYKV